MLLAGDVGGTKTLLGLFEHNDTRPIPVEIRHFHTADFADLTALIVEFLRRADRRDRIDGACFAVAGPVAGGRAWLTNVSWHVDAAEIASRFQLPGTWLLNDLEAMAWAIPILEPAELAVLQTGVPDPRGNAALIAAGTGLGVAIIHNVEGRFVPFPSEGGHTDFAPRTARERELHESLAHEYGRVEWEHLVSGPGLVRIHRFLHPRGCLNVPANLPTTDIPPLISTSALEGRCPDCVETLTMFVSMYGAAARNLALTAVATAGLYVGGGIAPKILVALKTPNFLDSFNAKSPMGDLLQRIPIRVILNSQTALLGAAASLGTRVKQ